jgi:hypothetical protein
MRCCVVALLIASCGRVGFDARDDASSGAGDGPPCTPQRLTFGTAATWPTLDDHGLAWLEGHTSIQLYRLDGNPAIEVARPMDGSRPVITWLGTRHALAYFDLIGQAPLRYEEIDDVGNVDVIPSLRNSDSTPAFTTDLSIIPTTTGVAVVWPEVPSGGSNDLVMQPIDATGAKSGTNLTIVSPSDSNTYGLATHDGEIAVAYSYMNHVFVGVRDLAGATIGGAFDGGMATLHVDYGTSQLVWDGEAVALMIGADLVRLTPRLAQLSRTTLPVVPGDVELVAFTPDDYSVAWLDSASVHYMHGGQSVTFPASTPTELAVAPHKLAWLEGGQVQLAQVCF